MIHARAQKALVLSPHPDDETLGCGGTIKTITMAGGQVDVAYLTRGELGTEPGSPAPQQAQTALAETRTQEARNACSILGVSSIFHLDGQDGQLHLQPELSDAVLQLLETNGYRSVFCPWQQDGHSDHSATYELLRSALTRGGGDPNIWLYEVWTPLRPNMLIPIDATMDGKLQAIRAYASQLACLDYLSGFMGMAQYRSLFCPPARYAEAFYICDRRTLPGG